MEQLPSVANSIIEPLILCFITFGAHQQVQACGGVYNASSGSITSPLYPSRYPPNQDCVYIINAPAGHRITLTFLSFDLADETANCDFDSLQIRDGGLSTSPYMGTFCGTTIYQQRSSSNTMWIQFHSDSSQSGPGFEANYTTEIISQKFFFSTASEPPNIFRDEIDIPSSINISPSGLQDPVAIDYDPQESRIYWTDRTQKTIRSANLDGTDVRLVRNLSSVAIPDGLCVDSLSRLIFYTDAGNKVIGMITMYSNTHRIVINSSLDNPKDIELDKHNGVMYWSDCGTTPTIERANYDGTGRQTLVSGGEYLNQPNALALDTQGGRLYWADGGTQKVGWVDLKDRSTSVILYEQGSLFHGMDIYKNDLFISDWHFFKRNWSVIHRYGTNGTKQDVWWYRGRFNDIRVYAEETEDKGPNGCGNNNGGCSYICIPTPGNRSKCFTDGTESSTFHQTPSTNDVLATESTTTSPGLVTSSSTGTESASTNTVIIIVVCVIAGVVVITVVVALVVVFKLRRKSKCKQDVASTQRRNKPDVPLEPPPAKSNSTFDDVDNVYSKPRPGKSGDNSSEAGARNCERTKTFTKNLVTDIARDPQAFTSNGDYVDGASVKEPDYDDFVSSHVTGESSCQQPVTFTQGKILPDMANREQATKPRNDYSNLGYEEEHVYDDFHSGHKTVLVGDEPHAVQLSVKVLTSPTEGASESFR